MAQINEDAEEEMNCKRTWAQEQWKQKAKWKRKYESVVVQFKF